MKYSATEDGSYCNAEFISRRNNALLEMFSKFKYKDSLSMSFKDYVAERINWCKSGSALGAKLKHEILGHLRFSKRVAMQHITAAQLDEYLDKVPMLISSAATKNENAKNRALYPTDIIHYFISDYILSRFENDLVRDLGFEENGLKEAQLADLGRRAQLSKNKM